MAGKKTAGGKKTAPKKQPEKKEEFSLIPHATLKALYADLLKCAAAAKRGAGKQGIDALPAGVFMDLTAGDTILSAIPDTAVKLKRKGKPTAQVSELFGLALGTGLIAKQRKSGQVSVIFGSSGTSEWADALGIAKRLALPLIFVSRASGVDEKADAKVLRTGLKERKRAKTLDAEGYLPRIHVDAQDVVAVYRVAHESIARARKGRGPAWIEGVPFEVDGKHIGSNAVASMEKYLQRKGLL